MNQSPRSTAENTVMMQPKLRMRLQSYLLRHIQVFFYSLGQLTRTPVSTLMTSMVIGIALALPTGFHVLLQNAQQISGGWESTVQISLFLKTQLSDDGAQRLQKKIRALPEVEAVEYISRNQALQEFKSRSGFGNALEALDDNPLPSVLVVKPQRNHSDPATTQLLLQKLQSMSDVEFAQLDMQWIRRLYAIMDTVQRGVDILAGLLALAVLLVVGNTIKLAIQNRRDEIVVIKLIGGTDGFIRRPFLYSGFWYGLFGGVIAWLLVTVSLLLLSQPIETLTGLYQNKIALHALSFGATLVLIIGSVLLGLSGSWFAVGRHLREIEPR